MIEQTSFNFKATKYLTVSQVSKILNVSIASAYALVHRDDFPSCQFGGNIRIPENALYAWIEQCSNLPRTLFAQ